MIFAKDTTYGLESKIRLVQTQLEEELPWFNAQGVSSNDIEIYNLIQRTQRGGLFKAEAYLGNGEYGEIFINDNVAATIGFYALPNREMSYNPTATIDAIFTVQLDIIHGDEERNQELAVIEAKRALEKNWINQVVGLKEHIPTVFADFDTTEILNRDMQPWYVFALTFETEYTQDIC